PMSAAEEAYQVAVEEIALVKAQGGVMLALSGDDTHALEVIPPEIVELTDLTFLNLDHTRVSDLSPLAALTLLQRLYLRNTSVQDLAPLEALTSLIHLGLGGTAVQNLSPIAGLASLEELWLDNTPVIDLRPIRGLNALNKIDSHFGLSFVRCAATEVDPRIAEIAGIEGKRERVETLFAYLDQWEPPKSADTLPLQQDSGFEVGVRDGRVAFETTDAPDDPQTRTLHLLIREDLDDLMAKCPGGHNAPYPAFRKLLERYRDALGADLDALQPERFWHSGCKLRIELKANAARSGTVMDTTPKLVEEVQTGLEALLAAHNAFVDGHPKLAALDGVSQDTIDRHQAAMNRDEMGAMVEAIEAQVALVMDEVRGLYTELHELSAGEDAMALRALAVEGESLENFISRVVREALIEEKSEGALQAVAGDIRATGVGAAAGAVAPYAATTFAQLVTVLEPQMAVLMSSMHGADYPVRETVQWIVNKLRDKARRALADEESRTTEGEDD
ncbi:MAG: hypothetical protein AAGP08_11615, partial [Pseudomonadota bacterium]